MPGRAFGYSEIIGSRINEVYINIMGIVVAGKRLPNIILWSTRRLVQFEETASPASFRSGADSFPAATFWEYNIGARRIRPGYIIDNILLRPRASFQTEKPYVGIVIEFQPGVILL